MKRILIATAVALSLVAPTAQALTEVITYIPAEWIQRDGSRTFYGTVNGPCGSAIFNVSKSLANFNELRDDLVVEACEGTANTVTFAKVCRDLAYC